MPSDPSPMLAADCAPPTVLGVAALSTLAFRGAALSELLRHIDRETPDAAALLYDRSVAHQLAFERAAGLALQAQALERSPLFRVRGGEGPRVLALLAPGDLMVNTPLDFVTAHTDVQLDLLYVLPGPLPAVIPDHDLAFFAVSEGDSDLLDRLSRLFRSWPRPCLNDPALLPALARDAVPRLLAGHDAICAPPAAHVARGQVEAVVRDGRPVGDLLPDCDLPVLIRPLHSHAGVGLARIDGIRDLGDYLLFTGGPGFVVTAFIDYASRDGLFRKYRVAFIEQRPFLCHMAISSHWMVHYLNAGMDESAAKRAEEAAEMANFDHGFARRHAGALAAVAETFGFDLFSIDCGETPDGRLLVFEADVAAILHSLDPPDLYPHKKPQMQRLYDAFRALVGRRAALSH